MSPPSERRVLAVAGGLGTVAVAVVVAVAAGMVPSGAVPRWPPLVRAIPHVNAALSLAAVPTIALGWRWIRGGDVERHRRAMLLTLGLFAAFLVLYLYRIALEGPTAFAGPATVERYVYHPLLAIHVLLAVVCVPLLVAAALLAATRPAPAIADGWHPRIGRVAAPLWLTSFALGVAVYLLLYWIY